MADLALKLLHYLKPRDGWLALGLLSSLVVCLVWSILGADWVPESGVVVPAGLLGFLLSSLLVQRRMRPAAAWTLLGLYGLVINLLWLARLLPPISALDDGWGSVSQFWRQQGALYVDRVAGWLQAVTSGGRSDETAVFALGLGLLAWFLSAYVAWSALQQRQPLYGLTAAGFALALNGYTSGSDLYWLALYVALAALAIAVLHFANLEHEWTARQVDYSDEIQLDMMVHAGSIAAVLLALSMLLPAFSITRLQAWLSTQPGLQQLEGEWNRLFGGVQTPRGGAGRGGPGGSGILPRAYLLGMAPELSETMVMTASLAVEQDGRLLPVTTPIPSQHWRALSYEVYTGRGWTLSEEREAQVPANQPIDLRPAAHQTIYRQTVRWLADNRIVRYTFGEPISVDQEVTAVWRGVDDLVRIQGSGGSYQVTSRAPDANATALRSAPPGAVPPAILARYSALPADLPPRVGQLARDVAGALPTPYDQARALEKFLRQYPYSLDVAVPPPRVDSVDYFLFELQAGYCDYYASAMVVLARSLGLPARLAVGFLAQPPDDAGVQSIRQIDGHSWAEIYFGGIGWVEFEPTAPFPASDPASGGASAADDAPADIVTVPAPPPADPRASPAWWWLLPAALCIALAVAWRRSHPPVPDGATAIYGRLQAHAAWLGVPAAPSQTPTEFALALWEALRQLGRQDGGTGAPARLVARMQAPIARIGEQFAARQYGHRQQADLDGMQAAWQQLKRPFWRLHLRRALRWPRRTGPSSRR